MTIPTRPLTAGDEIIVLEEARFMGLERLLTLCREMPPVNGLAFYTCAAYAARRRASSAGLKLRSTGIMRESPANRRRRLDCKPTVGALRCEAFQLASYFGLNEPKT